MGAARLLAKAWVVFCVFAGAYAARHALAVGASPAATLLPILVCVLLFGAMGLLFAGGFGVSGNSGKISLLSRFSPGRVTLGFNGIVFIVFAIAIFLVQTVNVAGTFDAQVIAALQAAAHFTIPGHRVLENRLAVCGLDEGRVTASAFSWLLAFIFLGQGVSRLRISAALVRLERAERPELLGASMLTMILGLISVVGIQFFFMGSIFPMLSCAALTDIPGELVIGLGPLMLAYLIVAALTDLFALEPQA